MKDQYNRNIEYIRLSLTDRCNLRCKYCMPETGVKLLNHEDILSYEELLKLAKSLVKLGINTFKLTGGEPLVRLGVLDFIKRLKEIEGVKEVTLTTNGILLYEMAQGLIESGIDRINVSLDTLDEEKYRDLTRGGDLNLVLKGINKLLDLGFENIKINCVPLDDSSEEDILSIARLAKDKRISVRFIELMPVGQGVSYRAYDNRTILDLLSREFSVPKSYVGKLGNGPANYYSFEGFLGKIGFIDALNNKFCGDCNRIRLTASGFLKLCLHYNLGTNIRELLKLDQDHLSEKLEEIIYKKPKEHKLGEFGLDRDDRNMNQIGG